MKKLTHVNSEGKAEMVDISLKEDSVRTASASGKVYVSEEAFIKIKNNEVEKGDVLSIAKFAGIQAAKKTSELIPLCHNIPISKIQVELKLNEKDSSVEITSFAKTVANMCKAIDKSINISGIRLISKTGGKSGDYKV